LFLNFHIYYTGLTGLPLPAGLSQLLGLESALLRKASILAGSTGGLAGYCWARRSSSTPSAICTES
jgi:hypothetical protein